MTATWTTPRTWAVNELVTPDLLNTQLRDNLEYLKSPPVAQYVTNDLTYEVSRSGYGSFVDVDGTNLSLTLQTYGGDVKVTIQGFYYETSATAAKVGYLDIAVDSARQGDTNVGLWALNGAQPLTLTYIVRNLAAGSHTFKLQWNHEASDGVSRFGVELTSVVFERCPVIFRVEEIEKTPTS